ncbi:hypothetical protein M0812_23616 [Anaeramoeba flamelloides]|nr:hypothetical protein M0812_23616 [Anaeramoeba flamelloides]
MSSVSFYQSLTDENIKEKLQFPSEDDKIEKKNTLQKRERKSKTNNNNHSKKRNHDKTGETGKGRERVGGKRSGSESGKKKVKVNVKSKDHTNSIDSKEENEKKNNRNLKSKEIIFKKELKFSKFENKDINQLNQNEINELFVLYKDLLFEYRKAHKIIK